MRFLMGLVVACLSLWTAQAMEIAMSQKNEDRQYCAGMYGRSTWNGPVDPFILVKFFDKPSAQGNDPMASLVIFEWSDRNLVGVPSPDGYGAQLSICGDDAVSQGLCNTTDIGSFIVAANATELSKSLILTKAIHLNDTAPIHYAIKTTGYYCVVTDIYTADSYSAVTEFRNAYGELPATQIPKLPFYGGITILYALLAVYWGFLYYMHRRDILAVQNYITAILVFLVVEMLMTWGFYDYQNRNGANLGSKVLLVVVGILNAARNSFSFFLLLIVCMGYGVVKPTLGRTMIWVRCLAGAHFVFGIVYAITSFLIAPESAGPMVLLVVLPLALTLTAFYVWTLNSLNYTLKDLRERKQNVKAAMYIKLWWSILISVVVIFGFFFFNSFTFASVNDPDFVPFHWKTRWFILDGWLNLVYFADVAWVAYIWRPTPNNRRFAMSDEIAQDDDGTFEIGDLGVPGDSDDDDDDEERMVGKDFPPPSNGVVGGPSTEEHGITQPPMTRHVPRDSVEGETIFAVGQDDDKFSDDEGSDEEQTKLVGGK